MTHNLIKICAALCVGLFIQAANADVRITQKILTEKKITNNYLDLPLREVMRDLTFQTDIPIFAPTSISLNLTGSFASAKLSDVLDILFAGTSISYRINNSKSSLIVFDSETLDSNTLEASIIEVYRLKWLSAKQAMELTPEPYSTYLAALEGDVGSQILITAPQAMFDRIISFLVEVDRDFTYPTTVFVPQNLTGQQIMDVLTENLKGYVTASKEINALVVSASEKKLEEIVSIIEKIDGIANAALASSLSGYVATSKKLQSFKVSNLKDALPKPIEDFVSYVTDTNEVLYFGPANLVSTFNQLFDAMDGAASNTQVAIFDLGKISDDSFIDVLPPSVRANAYFSEETGKLILRGTLDELGVVKLVADALGKKDIQITSVHNARNFPVDGFANELPKTLETYVGTVPSMNALIYTGPGSLYEEYQSIVDHLENQGLNRVAETYSVNSITAEVMQNLIPKQYQEFVVFDEAQSVVIVNGPAYVKLWAQNLVKQINSVEDAASSVFKVSNSVEYNLADFFPPQLRKYIFTTEKSDILVVHAPKKQMAKINSIIVDIDNLNQPGVSEVHKLPLIQGKAFEQLIPSHLRDSIAVDSENGIVIVRNSSEANAWIKELLDKLSTTQILDTQIFTLKNYDTGEFKEIMPKSLADYALFDRVGRRVIVHGPSDKVAEIEKLILMFDQQPTAPFITKVVRLNQLSVSKFDDLIPKSFEQYVFYDDQTKKVLIHAPLKIANEMENILYALDNPVSYEVALFEFVNFSSKGLEKLIPKEFANYVSVDEEQNSLLVNGPPEIVDYFRRIVESTQPNNSQIILEAKVVAFDNDNSISFGPEFNWPDITAGLAIVDDTFTDTVAGLYKPWEIQFGYSPDRSFTNSLNVSLQMLAQNSEATIYAAPTVVTENGSEAEIKVTTAEYVKVEFRSNGETDSSLEEIETGTVLKIKPTVIDDEIMLDIDVSVSDVVARGADNLPVVISRNASNKVKIDNGGTAAIAGLIDSRTAGRNAGLPGVRNIPLFGSFGSRKSESNNVKQVAIFVTAKTVGFNSTDKEYRSQSKDISSDEEFYKELKSVLKKNSK